MNKLCIIRFVLLTKFRKYIHNVRSARFSTTRKYFLQQQKDSHSCFFRKLEAFVFKLNYFYFPNYFKSEYVFSVGLSRPYEPPVTGRCPS